MLSQNSKGAIFMCLSALSFATMGAFAKYSKGFSFFQILFFRGLISALFVYFTAKKEDLNFFGKTSDTKKKLFVRSFLGTAGAVAYFFAIQKLYLADAVLLNNLSPIWVTFFAWFFLSEKPRKKQLILLFIMLIGAIFVIKPKLDVSFIYALIGFSSSILAGAAYTYVRYLSRDEKPSNLVLWFSVYNFLFMIPGMLFTGFRIPTPKEFFFLCAVGIFAGLGQLFLTNSYKLAQANKVSIFQYLNIFFAGLYGILFWGEFPDIYSLIGIIIVIISAFTSYQINKKS
ncbi:MAG: DMT family transporter [Fusobacteriaceae bacterium]